MRYSGHVKKRTAYQPKPWPAWAADLVTPCGICHAPLRTGEPVESVGRAAGVSYFAHAACHARA